MAANPNPTRITDALWKTWEGAVHTIPGVRLGGIYANKSGYHNFVYANQANWPGNYSIRLPLDLTGDLTKARAIDLTMSTAEMIKRTGYLKAAALHPDDDRLGCMREFYGTVNGTTVYGLTHDAPSTAWRLSSSDTSHLWHIHGSGFTLYVDDWDAAPRVYGWEGVISVLSGETWDAWVARKTGTGPVPTPSQQEDEMRLVYEARPSEGGTGSGTIWLLDSRVDEAGKPYLWAPGWDAVQDYARAGIPQTTVKAPLNLAFYRRMPDGSPPVPPVQVELSDEQLAEVAAAAKAGAEAGAPSQQQLEDAAFVGSQKAERE